MTTILENARRVRRQGSCLQAREKVGVAGFRRTNQRRNRSGMTPRYADIGGRNDCQLVSNSGEGWSRSGEWRVVS
jgi:hypothetical protein